MSKNIKITPQSESLKPGEKAHFQVAIDFPHSTKVRGIRAEFVGREKASASYTTTETGADGKTKTVTKTATEYTDIVKEEFLLLGDPKKGFFGRIGDSMKTAVGGGDHEEVKPGELNFDVEVEIPEDALASFKGKNCEVKYTLAVSVDIPIKFDWNETASVDLPPRPVKFHETDPIHVIFPDDTGRSFWNKKFGKDVRINLAVDRGTLTVGEQALAMLTIETPEPLKVKKIDVTLVGTEATNAHGHSDKAHHRHAICEVDSPGLISNESVHEFEVLIPELEGPCTQQGTNFDVSWGIEVRLHIPWAADPVILAPITILPAAQ